MKTIISLESYGDSRFKSWSKVLESVDKEQSNGYAFKGYFINAGQKHEMAIGTYIMQFGNEGSARYNKPCVRLLEVTADGLTEIKEWRELDRSWALEVRDEMAELISDTDKQEESPLASYSTEALLAELARRGINAE